MEYWSDGYKRIAQRVKTLCSMLSALSAFSLPVNGYDSGLERRHIWFL